MKKINNLIRNLKLEIKNSRRGFTIIEMIIYMGMLSILLGVLSQIFVTILDTQLESESTSSIQQDSSYILSRFMYDINNADSIISPVDLGDQGNTLTITIDGTPYSYGINPGTGNLEVSDGTGDYQLNGFDTSVSNLTFQRLGNLEGNDTIKINFTITGKTQKSGGPEIRNFQTTVGTR